MSSTITFTTKDNIQFGFANLLKDLKTDKYLVIVEKTDPSDDLVELKDEPNFSYGFYTELKDVLTYIIEKIRKNVYEETDIGEFVVISKNSFEYSITDEQVNATVDVSVYNLKDGDEKIIRTAFESAGVKNIN